RGEDGSVCRWARVLAYQPPDRFVISWDITPRWEIETDPERCSEVEVTFTAEGERRTLVVPEHRHLDRHGERWPSERDGVAGPGTAWAAGRRRGEGVADGRGGDGEGPDPSRHAARQAAPVTPRRVRRAGGSRRCRASPGCWPGAWPRPVRAAPGRRPASTGR